jgi:mannose-6-phosphate isomerase
MHFLEALLALHESFPEGPYLERATRIVELFMTKIFRPDAAVIPEYFHEDWSMARLGTDTAFFEPGHPFEWIWLLDRCERMAGVTTSETAAALWRSAMDHGKAADGMILDQVGLDLRPNGCNFRLWPHAEGCKAGAVRYESGSENGAGLAASMVGALNDSFLGRRFAAG